MQSGLTILILAASLVAASPCPAWGPGPERELGRSFQAPPPPPPDKPRALQTVSAADFRCLAMTVYWEAGGEPRQGQLAVAHVVLNRVGETGFADSICGVVHQGGPGYPCQFHWYCRGKGTQTRNKDRWAEAKLVARQALGERDTTKGALYFHLAALHPRWAAGRYSGAQVIGEHIFFRGRPTETQ